MDYLKTDKKYEMKREPFPSTMMHENVNALESLTTAQACLQSVPVHKTSFLSQNFESTLRLHKSELATIFSGFINEFTEFKKEIIARMSYEAKFLEFFSQIISSGGSNARSGKHIADPAIDYGQQNSGIQIMR